MRVLDELDSLVELLEVVVRGEEGDKEAWRSRGSDTQPFDL